MNKIPQLYIVIAILLVMALGFVSSLTAQVIPSSADLSYLLRPNALIHIEHKVVSKEGKKWIVLEVSSKNKTNLDSLTYGFAFTNNLSTPIETISQVSLNSFALTKLSTKRLYAFEATSENFNFLILLIGKKKVINTTPIL